jgi:hypothetical protein
MKRREFIALIVCTAGAWPLPVHAQSRTYRVALLTLENGEVASQLTVPLRDLGYVNRINDAGAGLAMFVSPASSSSYAELKWAFRLASPKYVRATP